MSVILFGSRARGTHDADSDADVAVILSGKQPEQRMPVVTVLAGISFDIILETGIDISPLPIWTSEWDNPETYSNPALIANIIKDGIEL